AYAPLGPLALPRLQAVLPPFLTAATPVPRPRSRCPAMITEAHALPARGREHAVRRLPGRLGVGELGEERAPDALQRCFRQARGEVVGVAGPRPASLEPALHRPARQGLAGLESEPLEPGPAQSGRLGRGQQ